MEFLNDWEERIDSESIKEKKDYNLDTLYDHTHSELSLQQSKRDQIITLYLALFSFIIPFSLSLDSIAYWMRGMIFLVVGIIGVLFSFINVRYRVYKEVYWLSCQAITVLMNVKEQCLNKQAIQRAFYYSLRKKGKSFMVEKGGEKHFSRAVFVKKNTFSSETFYHIIQVLITSAILCLGVALILSDAFGADLPIAAAVGCAVFAAAFLWLMFCYFKRLMKVYAPLSYHSTGNAEKDMKERNARFNTTFSKAWTLHVYYGE